jgi:DNA-binding CsgD family transcriptional regulator
VLEPAGALRPEVLLQLGRVGRLVGDAAALDVLRQAQEAARDPDLHEQAVGEQALLVGLDDRPDAAVVLLDRAIAELHDDPTRVARLAGLRDAYLLIHDGLAAQAGPLSERTVGEAGTNLGSAATLATAAAQAALLTRGTAEAAADMAVRALGGGGLDGQPGRDTLLYGWAARALLWADRGALAAPAIESAAAWAHQRAWRNGLVVAHAWRAWLAHWEGRTRDARAEAGAALGVADSVGKFGEDFALAVFVEASIDAAEMDEARLQLERHGVAAAEPPATSTGLLVLWARCRLALAEQRFAEAHHDAVTMLAVGERRGGLPLGIRPTAALAHWAVGAREHAAELLEVELAAARSWGAGSHIGVALRESGRIAGGRRGLALLHEADEVLAKSPRRLEHARTLLALGAALRRDGQRIASREQLRLALDLGAALGARALVDEAVAELRASGGRLRRVSLSGLDALTPSEHRVARMAADGLTNQQIAQALFVTRATVERHLTQVYRKLDVPSREGLGERLGTPS